MQRKICFGKNNECMKIFLKKENNGQAINIDSWKIRNDFSIKNIKTALTENEVRGREHQKVVLEDIIMKTTEYEKLERGRRYEVSGLSLPMEKDTVIVIEEKDKDNVIAVEFTLGSIEIQFELTNVKQVGENTEIVLAEMTMYSLGRYTYEYCEE